MPYRQLHFDEAVFGSLPEAFDPSRFLRNKDLNRNPSFKPFGGGSTMCSGRFLAKYEVLAFVALAIDRFEIKVADGEGGSQQRFPRFNQNKPGLGIMEPLNGDDLIVEVRKRKV